MTDIMYYNISEKKLFSFSEILCFTQSLQEVQKEIKRLLHEKVKVYGREDTGNLSPEKQTRADAYFIIEILKHF